MGGGRYVLLGLAPARSDWFRDVAHWAMQASSQRSYPNIIYGG